MKGSGKRLFTFVILPMLTLGSFFFATSATDTASKPNFASALPLLSRVDYGGCVGTSLESNGLSVNFPQTLPSVKTICGYQMERSVELSVLKVTVLFNYSANLDLKPSAVAGESDEFSIWAGQPEDGYFKDVEWGLVSRIQNNYTSMFLQVGNGQKVLSFAEVPLQHIGRKLHTYTCGLAESKLLIFTTLTLTCNVDDGTTRQISWTGVAFDAPNKFGLIAKSMRVTDPSTGIFGTMKITDLEYAT